MNFENEIKLLANEIYEKVVKIVNENKESDNVLYDYAYLTLENGMQGLYSFRNGDFFVTKPEVKGYVFAFSHEVRINGMDTEYDLDDIKYETLLNEKINEKENERQRICLGEDLERQDNLPEEQKQVIKSYYEQLNSLVDTMTYNKENTHNPDNYNYDTIDIYCAYMHQKELNKLEESKETVLPAVKLAVDWWAKKISGDLRAGSLGNDPESKFRMVAFDFMYPKESVSSDQLEKFKEILAKKIMDEIYESDDLIKMECEMGPALLLYEAMKESGIDPKRTPFYTRMYIRAYYVAVKDGWGAKEETLYDSTDEQDLENIKKICCSIKNKEQQKVLGKTIQ